MEFQSRDSFKIIAGLIVCIGLVHMLKNEGIRFPNEDDALPVIEWVDSTCLEHKKVFILMGSSNVGCSLISSRLDSICRERDEVWYNLAQRGMTDFELVDYTSLFVQQLDSGQVSGIYMELNVRPIYSYEADWRRSSILHLHSIVQISLHKLSAATSVDQVWNGFKFGIQSCLMKAVEPIHNWLHPPTLSLRSSTKGFHYPPNSKRWTPRTRADSLILENRKSRYRNYVEFISQNVLSEEIMDEHLIYPFKNFQKLNALCREKGIVLNPLCFPTERTEHLLGSIQSLIARKPMVLFHDSEGCLFANPMYLRDPIHLNLKGANIISDEFALRHMKSHR